MRLLFVIIKSLGLLPILMSSVKYPASLSPSRTGGTISARCSSVITEAFTRSSVSFCCLVVSLLCSALETWKPQWRRYSSLTAETKAWDCCCRSSKGMVRNLVKNVCYGGQLTCNTVNEISLEGTSSRYEVYKLDSQPAH